MEGRTAMDALDYTKQLVSFESTSVLSNVPVTDYAEEQLRRIGFLTERIEYDDKNGVRKACVVGRKGPGKGGMAYFGHTDVVPADPWFSEEHGPFEPTVVGDRLYGRGSCDMKGSVACMLAAAEQFSPGDLQKPVYITCTADEEIGYGGAAQVAERSDLFQEMVGGNANAIIGEPTLLEVVYAHKGVVGLIARSKGKASHSSTREGLNANLAMIPYLVEMKKIHDELEADTAWHNDEFDPPVVSWNIGINDHTKAVNITPPQSICTVYFRAMPGQDAGTLIDRARAAAEQNGLEFEVPVSGDPVYTDPNSDFVKEVQQLAGREKATTVSYGTDGAKLSALKNKVVFGPGSIAQAHTHDEWIALDQLTRGTEMYAKLIRHWCC
jgi:acetylornithine deacetylase